VYTCWLT